jgi:CRISPR/Cas system CMR-associated protein Cmr3 (group 5 of RAMP superfamily)
MICPKSEKNQFTDTKHWQRAIFSPLIHRIHFVTRAVYLEARALNNKFENLDLQFSGDFTYRTNILFKFMPPCGGFTALLFVGRDKGSD